MIGPLYVLKQIRSGEIKYSFEYCEFLTQLRRALPRVVRESIDVRDLRGALNAGGEL